MQKITKHHKRKSHLIKNLIITEDNQYFYLKQGTDENVARLFYRKNNSSEDTVANRILLADEHLLLENYSRASELYESCHDGIYKDDEELLLKMLKASYHNDEFGVAIKYGEKISENSLLKNKVDRIFLAWAYYERYRYDEAERVFKEMDARFTNYTQRLEYTKFFDVYGST